MKKIFQIILLLLLSTAVQAQPAPQTYVLEKGFNNPWFFSQFPTGYPTEAVIQKMISLDIDVLRYQGGTSSFYGDINKPGYGNPGEIRPNFAAAHVKLAARIGAKTAYVANLHRVLAYKEDENYWIQNIVEHVKVLNPAYVELGNECPIYPEITGVTNGSFNIFNRKKNTAAVKAGVQRYVTLCGKVMAAIRAAGYDPEFGMVMDQPFHERGLIWNDAIRSSGLDYDAEIFHIYLTTRDVLTTQNMINKSLTGSQKKIWITEWGWVHGMDSQKGLSDIGKDYYNAFPLNFVTACSYDKRIVMILRHQLYGTSPYCVIRPDMVQMWVWPLLFMFLCRRRRSEGNSPGEEPVDNGPPPQPPIIPQKELN